MAFNGSGTHVRVHDWTTDLNNTVPVTASRMDAEHDDMSTALSLTICRDGQSTTTARIPFAAGVSAAAGSASAASYAQTNDTNTGLYFPAVDQWGLSAGGTGTLTSTATALTAAVTVNFTGAAVPTSSDGAALGSASLMWSDLFLASGAVVNFNSGDVTVTHSANALAFAGASSGYTFDAAGTFGGLLTVSTGGAAITGALAASGNLAINTDKFTVAAASGNAVVAGTLTVASNLTVSAGTVSLPAVSVADAALALPGAMKLLATVTASNSATVDFETTAAFDGTYDRLMITIDGAMPQTDDVQLYIRLKIGGSYLAGASDYYWNNDIYAGGLSAITTDAADNQIKISPSGAGNGVGNAAGEAFDGECYFRRPAATSLFPHVWWSGCFDRAGADFCHISGSGRYNSTGAFTGIRFLFSSGNIVSGEFHLYGLKKS